MKLDLESERICRRISDSKTCIAIQTVAEDVYVWAVGPKSSVNPFK